MTKAKWQREIQPTNETAKRPKRARGSPEKPFRIDDSPENVARALWGERSTKFPKKTT